MSNSLFGKYNFWIDEFIHLLISLLVSLFGVFFGLNWGFFWFCFLSGILIDLDHLLNPLVAKIFGIKDYQGGIQFGSGGYTFKILHGFDVAILLSFFIFVLFDSFLFSVVFFLSLVGHELWDFLVYPHSRKELFLVSRVQCRFRPGQRNKLVGKIFDLGSLKY